MVNIDFVDLRRRCIFDEYRCDCNWRIRGGENQEVIEIDIPGVKKDEVEVSVSFTELRVDWVLRGKKFYGLWALREAVNTREVTAKMEDGVLKVFLPITPQTRRTVPVQ